LQKKYLPDLIWNNIFSSVPLLIKNELIRVVNRMHISKHVTIISLCGYTPNMKQRKQDFWVIFKKNNHGRCF
jgi:hypothetical protein